MESASATTSTVSQPSPFRVFEAMFGGGGSVETPPPEWLANIYDVLGTVWDVYSIIAFIFSAVLIFGIIYAYVRNNQLIQIEVETIRDQERLYKELYQGTKSNTRWQDVERHLESDNPNDWKLAIIEADIMLEEALTNAGYAGTTIGEQLKSASPISFTTLDDAWRAHKIRNQIAHGGADFVLTRKLAQETIVQYRRVFQEFGVV